MQDDAGDRVHGDGCVLLHRSDDVGWITLNRPSSLNALDVESMEKLAECVTIVAEDDSVKVVVLAGAGRAFCSGGDMQSMDERRGGLADVETFSRQVRDVERFADSSLHLHEMPKPTIAMVDGYAVGAGFALALACDLRIVSTRARFIVRFQELGLSGDYGISYFLVRALGYARAIELSLLPRTLTADQARALGLVTEIVEPESLRATVETLAAKLAAGPTYAYAKTKENLANAGIADLRAVIRRESQNTKLASLSDDVQLAMRAFLDSRQRGRGGATPEAQRAGTS